MKTFTKVSKLTFQNKQGLEIKFDKRTCLVLIYQKFALEKKYINKTRVPEVHELKKKFPSAPKSSIRNNLGPTSF